MKIKIIEFIASFLINTLLKKTKEATKEKIKKMKDKIINPKEVLKNGRD
jgi:hypothetical protein